ncbi:MAG: AMP-binding protein, partial [Chloroflexia bacterium]
MYVGDWLYRRELLTPNRVALLDAQRDFRPVTYKEWNRAANRTANWLASLGVKQGDLIAVLSVNCVEYLDIWFACGKLGVIMQTLNWRLTPHELTGLLAEATPAVLLYGGDFSEQAAGLRERVEGVRHFVALDGAAKADPSDRDFRDRDSFSDSPHPSVELTWDSPWVICYTGGTTGLPRGAVLTHGNIAWNSINTVMSWGISEHDFTFCNMPMFHTGGLNVLTAPLVHVGGTSIVCTGVDVDQIFDLVERFPISIFFAVPTIFTAMQQHPRWESFDFSKVRWVVSGGAPCPPPIFEKWWEKGIEFKTGYGMTESGPNTFWLPKELVKQKLGSVGRPLFHVEVKVIGPDGTELGA